MPVISVTQDQQVDAAGLIEDVYTVTFTIAGRPGSFTVTVPLGGDVYAAVEAAVQQIASQVTSLYGITV